jgi:hypothetical protein
MAFALGILPRVARQDLTLINQVRNYFAHDEIGVASFQNEKPKSLCAELSLVKWAKRTGRYERNPQAREPRRQYISRARGRHQTAGDRSGR